jgi:ABC-type Fe3+ transport system permease subunit
MSGKRQVQVVAATVVLGLAVALGVLAVALLQALEREYGRSGWDWWADPTSYLILAVPVLLAVVGGLLARRARRR